MCVGQFTSLLHSSFEFDKREFEIIQLLSDFVHTGRCSYEILKAVNILCRDLENLNPLEGFLSKDFSSFCFTRPNVKQWKTSCSLTWSSE